MHFIWTKIPRVPVEIGLLTELTWLSLSHNKLTSLAKEILNLKELGLLSLYGNPLKSYPPGIRDSEVLVILPLLEDQKFTKEPKS